MSKLQRKTRNQASKMTSTLFRLCKDCYLLGQFVILQPSLGGTDKKFEMQVSPAGVHFVSPFLIAAIGFKADTPNHTAVMVSEGQQMGVMITYLLVCYQKGHQ
jgi:hypothetical protein